MTKIGDEFIIEIDSVMTNKKGTLYGIKGFKSLVFDDYGLEQLQKIDRQFITDEMISQYQRGFKDGYEKARETLLIAMEEV